MGQFRRLIAALSLIASCSLAGIAHSQTTHQPGTAEFGTEKDNLAELMRIVDRFLMEEMQRSLVADYVPGTVRIRIRQLATTKPYTGTLDIDFQNRLSMTRETATIEIIRGAVSCVRYATRSRQCSRPSERNHLISIAIGAMSSALVTTGYVSGGNDDWLPWPPYDPSSSGQVSKQFLASTYGGVASKLRLRLRASGYERLYYFKIPGGGFAVLTPLERLAENANPATENRFKSGKVPYRGSIIASFWRMIQGDTSKFRTIAFIVTSQRFRTKPFKVTEDMAHEWFSTGESELPDGLADLSTPRGTRVHVFVYEFENVRDRKGGIAQISASTFSFSQHMASVGIRND